MSILELIQYYVDLLIIQYRGKPKAEGTIRAAARELTLDGVIEQVQNAHNLDTAVGVQLDNVVGKYAGVKRSGYGFDSYITLTDDEYRVLITLAIVKNNSDSSLASIESLLFNNFGLDIKVYDYRNMRMSYSIDSDIVSKNVTQLFITQGLLPSPMGVGIGSTIYTPDDSIFYGFQRYGNKSYVNTPMNRYGSYSLVNRWLRYTDLVETPTQEEGFLLLESSGKIKLEDDGNILR